jgi:hypothetical protein
MQVSQSFLLDLAAETEKRRRQYENIRLFEEEYKKVLKIKMMVYFYFLEKNQYALMMPSS